MRNSVPIWVVVVLVSTLLFIEMTKSSQPEPILIVKDYIGTDCGMCQVNDMAWNEKKGAWDLLVQVSNKEVGEAVVTATFMGSSKTKPLLADGKVQVWRYSLREGDVYYISPKGLDFTESTTQPSTHPTTRQVI